MKVHLVLFLVFVYDDELHEGFESVVPVVGEIGLEVVQVVVQEVQGLSVQEE